MSDLQAIVVTDANLVINFLRVGRVRLLGQLPGLRFVLPEEVVAEVTLEDQRTQLTSALAEGVLSLCSLTDLAGLALFSEFRAVMGAGESACLAIAELNGWWVASDERKRFRREAIARLGQERLLTTPALYVRAIRAGLITVEEADADKALLATRRFVMNFASFSELMNPRSE